MYDWLKILYRLLTFKPFYGGLESVRPLPRPHWPPGDEGGLINIEFY